MELAPGYPLCRVSPARLEYRTEFRIDGVVFAIARVFTRCETLLDLHTAFGIINPHADRHSPL